jgi:uncharacterized protein YbbC (DUF1343 family)
VRDLIASARNVRLVATLSPSRTLAVPDGVDVVLLDVQEPGASFSDELAAAVAAMEQAARRHLRLVVLDRPNPLGGYEIEGPVSSVAVRHGMSLGELLGLLNAERSMGADLTVVKMEGWRRADYFDATGLIWVNPSPDVRDLNISVLIPGLGLLEATNVSIGRGTNHSLEVVGAPWADGKKLSDALNRAGLPGARFVPVLFVPGSGAFKGIECRGVMVLVTDRHVLRPVRVAVEIARQLRVLFGAAFDSRSLDPVLGHDAAASLAAGRSSVEVESAWSQALQGFALRRSRYLLY